MNNGRRFIPICVKEEEQLFLETHNVSIDLLFPLVMVRNSRTILKLKRNWHNLQLTWGKRIRKFNSWKLKMLSLMNMSDYFNNKYLFWRRNLKKSNRNSKITKFRLPAYKKMWKTFRIMLNVKKWTNNCSTNKFNFIKYKLINWLKIARIRMLRLNRSKNKAKT